MIAQEALRTWLEHLAHERRSSPRTLEAYGAAVSAYLFFLERHRGEAITLSALGTITASELRAYLASRRSGDHPLALRSLSHRIENGPKRSLDHHGYSGRRILEHVQGELRRLSSHVVNAVSGQ